MLIAAGEMFPWPGVTIAQMMDFEDAAAPVRAAAGQSDPDRRQ